MSKIEIKDLYLVFGNEKQKALKMLKEGKTKSEILKATGCTVAVKMRIFPLMKAKYSSLWGCPVVESPLYSAASTV